MGLFDGPLSLYKTGESVDTSSLVPRDEWLQNGFVDAAELIYLWNDSTRTLTVSPVGSTFQYHLSGILYTTSGVLTETIADTEGLWVFYINGEDSMTSLHNPSDAQIESIIEDRCIVSYLYWDAANNDGRLMPEWHGSRMSPVTHKWIHNSVGSVYQSGMALSDFVIDDDGDDDEDAQFSVAVGKFYDEDIAHILSGVVSTVGLEIWSLSGTSWRWTTNPGFSVLTTGTGRLAWNDSGSQTEVTNNDFVLCHVFATNIMADNGKLPKYIAVQGQAKYNTIGQARIGAETEINALAYGSLPLQEIIPVGTVIFQTSDSYGNTVKGRTRTTNSGDNYVDWRASNIKASGGSIADHGALAGLADDDHSQYLLLAGRAGGQTAIGGTQSGEDLILQSTSNATRGSVIFGSAGTSVYDEVNARWGLGTNSPLSLLHVKESGGAIAGIGTPQLIVQHSATANSNAVAYIIGGTGSDATGLSALSLGTEALPARGFLAYYHSINALDLFSSGVFQLSAGGSQAFFCDSSQKTRFGSGSVATSVLRVHICGSGVTVPSYTAGYEPVLLLQNNKSTSNNCFLSILAGNAGISGIDFADTNASRVGYIDYNHSTNALTIFSTAGDLIFNAVGQTGLIRCQDELKLREDFPNISGDTVKSALTWNPSFSMGGSGVTFPTSIGLDLSPTVTMAGAIPVCSTIRAKGTYSSTGGLARTFQLFNAQPTMRSNNANIPPVTTALILYDACTVKSYGSVNVGTVDKIFTVDSVANIWAADTSTMVVTEVAGCFFQPFVKEDAGANLTISLLAGLKVDDPIVEGSPTLAEIVGVEIKNLTKGNLNLSLRSARSDVQMRHAGSIYIGNSSIAPSEKLHVGFGNIRLEGGDSTGFIDIGEYYTTGDPSAPDDNRARLYVRDNGAGKEQLCVLFNTGAVQVLATEP